MQCKNGCSGEMQCEDQSTDTLVKFAYTCLICRRYFVRTDSKEHHRNFNTQLGAGKKLKKWV